jgi:glycosyltransferase involved in cell wall biosynthesis
MKTAKACIVIPTYNREELIGETLRSALGQSEPNIEVIVVDDMSNDGTEAIVREMAKQDPRLTYVRQSERLGAPAARNRGAEMAKSDFVMFLDSDDLIHPDKIRSQLKMHEEIDCDACVCQTAIFTVVPEDAVFLMNDLDDSAYLQRFLRFDLAWHTAAPLWRRNVFLKIGGFRPDLSSGQDFELHGRALILGVNFQTRNETLSYYRSHEGERISSSVARDIKNRSLIFESFVTRLKEQSKWNSAFQNDMALNFLWLSILADVGKDLALSLELRNRAFSYAEGSTKIKIRAAQSLARALLSVRRTTYLPLLVYKNLGLDMFDREYRRKEIPCIKT